MKIKGLRLAKFRGHASSGNVIGVLIFFFTDDPVKDKIVRKAMVMDALALHLDRSVCPGSKDVPVTQRWEHLADELEVPYETKKRCENFVGKSPSETMFDYLSVTEGSLSIKTLKFHLCKLERKDVVSELDKNSILSRGTLVFQTAMYNTGRSFINLLQVTRLCFSNGQYCYPLTRRLFSPFKYSQH